MNKIAKCYKELYVTKVVKEWLREAGPLIFLQVTSSGLTYYLDFNLSDWIMWFLPSSAGVPMYAEEQFFKSDWQRIGIIFFSVSVDFLNGLLFSALTFFTLCKMNIFPVHSGQLNSNQHLGQFLPLFFF